MSFGNMKIDVLAPQFDPAQNRYKVVARATIETFEFVNKAELVGSKFKADAMLAGARDKAIGKILVSVVEAAERIKEKLPSHTKGDSNDGNSGS